MFFCDSVNLVNLSVKMPFMFYKHNKEKYTHNDREAITPIVSQVFYFFENVSVSLDS